MPCIVLFDSGVGGLSVLQAIKQRIPHADIIYFADHQFAPFGNKDPQWLNAHIIKRVEKLNQQHQPDAIIIACNTASTLCLDALRACINTPIIGVVPAIKTAAQLTQHNAIGILATPTTIDGPYLHSLIDDFAKHCKVTKVASTELVTMAEYKLNQQPFDHLALACIIEPFITANCDYVVLGCTHFPHLKAELTQLAPNIQWIDSADAIAKRCEHVLPVASHTDNKMKDAVFYSSANIQDGLRATLKAQGFMQIHSNA